MSNSLIYPIILGREAYLSANRILDFIFGFDAVGGNSDAFALGEKFFVGSGSLCVRSMIEMEEYACAAALVLGAYPVGVAA
jgi:hypothetical protein